MTVAELIDALRDLPQDLTVMAAGETAQKVIVEECQGNRYVRIFEPWDVEFVGRAEAEYKRLYRKRRKYDKRTGNTLFDKYGNDTRTSDGDSGGTK